MKFASQFSHTFLTNYFDPQSRSQVVKLFLAAIDRGLRDAHEIVDDVCSAAREILENDGLTRSDRRVMTTLVKWCEYDRELALDCTESFITYCDQIDEDQGIQMWGHLPPTTRQIERIRELGYRGSLPTNRGDADKLIRRLESEGGDSL